MLFKRDRYAAERRAAVGYVVATTDGGEWAIVLGAHWERIPLFPTASEANVWFAGRWADNMPHRSWYHPTTVRVRRVGKYFKIINPD